MENLETVKHQLSIQVANNNQLLSENKELQEEITSLKSEIDVLKSELIKYRRLALSDKKFMDASDQA